MLHPPAPRNERSTQNRVLQLLTSPAPAHDSLHYAYLGNHHKREKNSNLEESLLTANLTRRGYAAAQINAAIVELRSAIELRDDSLYAANERAYRMLRYGAKVQTAAGERHETVHFIDWDHVEANDFAVAEEVTLKEGATRRPDLVFYVNGIALAVAELKRSSNEIGEGVRQLISNQDKGFNQGFFTTIQLLIAGNDTQGVRYGTVGTPEEFYTTWPYQGDTDNATENGQFLDRPLRQLLDRDRLLDLVRYFVLFDNGRKKVPRPHQYEAVKAAQRRLAKGEGGVIWHTQGSGKSILMVLLAQWVLETDPNARILIITDRRELDDQIEGTLRNAGLVGKDSPSSQVSSRADFVQKLEATEPRLMSALVHKFESDLTVAAPTIHGRFYIFVDECHRTQSGKLGKQMRAWLPEAIMIGFTGTPLLKAFRRTVGATSQELFGSYIHTYKFHEAVADGVVLDLKYQARAIPQRMMAAEKVDTWFNEKTRGLNGFQQAVLRKRWATLENLMSSSERKDRIVADVIWDFATKDRLKSDRGTAILVASSIYDACGYFRKFKSTPFGKTVALITSYQPNPSDISNESADSDNHFKYETYTELVLPGYTSTEDYETKAKERFIKEPANCKLLIVVSKLLTGFDAPSCSYIYLDNEMRDHTLFQAICRTNRLDGEDKDYGYIVDYKELFAKVEESIAVYTSDELEDGSDYQDSNIELKDWLQEGRHQFDEFREKLHYLCDPVLAPRQLEQYLEYFCGNHLDPEALARTEPLRIQYYKLVAGFVRAYGAIANDLINAGYGIEEIVRIQAEINFHADTRAAVKRYSGEELDTKPFESDMRHLINAYVQADPAEGLGDLGEHSLVELIIDTGINDAIAQALNKRGKLSQNSVAEAIVNNVRKTIIRDQLTDPRFYAKMSELLADLIRQRQEQTLAYEDFLKQAEALVREMSSRDPNAVPANLKSVPRAHVVYRNLPTLATSGAFVPPTDPEALAQLTLKLDEAMRHHAPAGWKEETGGGPKKSRVVNALYPLLQKDKAATYALFDLLALQADY